jgi:retron-type reverse transcriptase
MKRFAGIVPRIATWENVALAFHKAAAGKRRRPAVERFAANLDGELNDLVRELAGGSWQPGIYERFTVRDPKVRVIHAAPFRDRVVHHAIMNVAGPCFEHGAVAHSYACRQGRGNLAAVYHAARCTRSHRFFLKLDIRRYFDSIHHDTLRELFRRRFKDGAFLRLLDRVLDSFHVTAGRGIPIGSLTSQYFANLYLDAMDHWIMEGLGCPAYARYMDDFVLWHDDEGVLQRWLGEITAWLAAERRLELKSAPHPARCREGVPFLGYRITPAGVLLGRRARRRFSSTLRDCEEAHAAGRLSSLQLQRRTDALLAFVRVAECRSWRQRFLATRDSAPDSCT